MTLFGRTLGPEEIASLVFLLMVLVLWIGAWRQDRNWARWFRDWEAGRKERRDAERAAEGGDHSAPPGAPRGPWG
ncbi:MAG: hypothetical protein EON89_13695 [Brevundimonas sp.]|nr:MAG: hypothetical protein EON89_13695 [Brevundimonas sp.]